MKKILYLFFFVFLKSTCAYSSDTNDAFLDNTIHIGTPGVKQIRIAIPKFVKNFNDINTKINLNEYNLNSFFSKMLEFTNWFDLVPENTFLAGTDAAKNLFNAQDWSIIKVEYVVYGKLYSSSEKDKFDLELRLYDVKENSMVLGKKYSNLNFKSSNLAMRRFGDLMIKTITGIPGPFMSRIVFVGRDSLLAKSSRIYIADFDGSNAFAITNNRSINISPAWSPDGIKVTYTSFVSGKAEIYQYNLITKKTFRMTNTLGNNSGSTWSPSGDRLAFSSSTKNGKTHIHTMNIYGGEVKSFIDSNDIEVEPAYSFDGKYLAYTSNKYGKPMIFLKNLFSNEVTRVTYSGWYNASAAWDPSSTNLAFASYDRSIDRWDIFKVSPNGESLERLTLKEGDNEKPSWSPDGRFILFQTTRETLPKLVNVIDKNHKLYVMSKNGLYPKILNTGVTDVRQPAWGPRISFSQD